MFKIKLNEAVLVLLPDAYISGYFNFTTFPFLADLLAASRISITIILFSSDDRSKPGMVEKFKGCTVSNRIEITVMNNNA